MDVVSSRRAELDATDRRFRHASAGHQIPNPCLRLLLLDHSLPRKVSHDWGGDASLLRRSLGSVHMCWSASLLRVGVGSRLMTPRVRCRCSGSSGQTRWPGPRDGRRGMMYELPGLHRMDRGVRARAAVDLKGLRDPILSEHGVVRVFRRDVLETPARRHGKGVVLKSSLETAYYTHV